MAAVEALEPFQALSNNNQYSGERSYHEGLSSKPSLKETTIPIRDDDTIPAAFASPVEQILGDDSDKQPNEKPANTLHESYPVSNLELPDHHIDDVRSLRVTVIGAGLSGILAGILLPVKVPKLQLTILEKNDDVVSPSDHPILKDPSGPD